MNFIKCTAEVYLEYGIDITGERKLSDGDVIKHFETSDPHWVIMKDDERVTFWTYDALTSYLEFVLGE